MKKYLYVGFAGILGSLTRYFISNAILNKVHYSFPLSTFVINITGCLILGFFLTTAIEFFEFEPNMKLAISTGFIGSYTTFSTFTNEINALINKHQLLIPFLYLISSFTAGVLAIWLGTVASRQLFDKHKQIECED